MQGYELVEPLSAPPIGQTFRVRRVRDGKFFVMKKVSYVGLSKADKKRVVDTTNYLIRLSIHSTGVARYHNTQVDTEVGTINLFMEYYPAGSLEMLIRNAREARTPIDVEKIWSIATDIALALYDCHSNSDNPLAHGSLRSDHVFLDADESAKIGCFGLNTCFDVDREKDLADLGAILYEMATLSPLTSKRDASASKLRHVDEGLRNLIIALVNPVRSDEKWNLLSILEYPEVALKVLQKKLKIETDLYEQEKQRFFALKQDVASREKRAGVETAESASLDA